MFLVKINKYNSKSFIIKRIILSNYTDLENNTQIYRLDIFTKKDKNFLFETGGRFCYSGTEEQILNNMKNNLFMDKILGEEYKLDITQKCFDDFKDKLASFERYIFDENQKKIAKLCLKRGFDVYYSFDKAVNYSFMMNDLKINFQNNGCKVYVHYNIEPKQILKYHPLYKVAHSLIIRFLKTGEIPISTSLKTFNEFFEDNKELLDGKIIKDEKVDDEYSIVDSIYGHDKSREIMRFNINALSYRGIDIKPTLLKLLKIKNSQLKIKNHFKD